MEFEEAKTTRRQIMRSAAAGMAAGMAASAFAQPMGGGVAPTAREGADVAINYLPAEEPDPREVVELSRAAGRKALPLPGDRSRHPREHCEEYRDPRAFRR